MINWITENKEWLLDGLGVFLLSLVVAFIGWLFKRKSAVSNGSINQSMGNNAKADNIVFKNNRQTVNDKSETGKKKK